MDYFRPQSLSEYLGQQRLKDRLQVHIEASKATGIPMEHILLVGPPGMGKTSLGQLIAQGLDVPFQALTMPVKIPMLIKALTYYEGVLLLDELQAATPRQQEDLQPLLEFGVLYSPSGQRHPVGKVTIIGTTTAEAEIIAPLRQRFPIQPPFEPYTEAEMGQIVASMARKAGLEMSTEMAEALGRATGGTPRNARQFVVAARDLTATGNKPEDASEILEFCEVSADGLTLDHRRYLKALDTAGGMAGLNSLMTLLNKDGASVRELERLLMTQNLVLPTNRGRELTPLGYRRVRELA